MSENRRTTRQDGTTVELTNGVILLDHPDAPEDMRPRIAGRIVEGCFQPVPDADFAMSPGVMRIIANFAEGTTE